jgi:hypothetical protein
MEDEFTRNVRLGLKASDRYDKEQTCFEIEFSSTARDIKPPFTSKLILIVDEVPRKCPGRWNQFDVTHVILSRYPRYLYWWMTESELRDWLGVGSHSLEFQFRQVRSNILRIQIPREGRPSFDPQLEVSSWTKER